MIQTYKRPNMPESFKRPYIIIDGNSVVLFYTIYGATQKRDFSSIEEANDYASANSINNLPDAQFYD